MISKHTARLVSESDRKVSGLMVKEYKGEGQRVSEITGKGQDRMGIFGLKKAVQYAGGRKFCACAFSACEQEKNGETVRGEVTKSWRPRQREGRKPTYLNGGRKKVVYKLPGGKP